MAVERKKKRIALAVDNSAKQDVEVEIAPDTAEAGEQDDGSYVVDLGENVGGLKGGIKASDIPHDANLAEYMEDNVLDALGSELVQDVEDDLISREEWEETYRKGLRLLGMTIEERSEPWDGACGIVHPILAESVIRFQAELVTETFPAAGPVKTKILGAATKDKEEAADRVREDMNHEITDVMTEYRAEHERMLFNLPVAGSALKKVYFDPTLGRQTSMFVSAEDFIVAYGASDLATCPRYTQRMRKTGNDIKKLMVAGFYRTIELPEGVRNNSAIDDEKDKLSGQSDNKDDRNTLYEINVDIELPGFEDPLDIALPYIVTVDKDSRKVLSIRRNWDANEKTRLKKQHFVHYTYIPGFGFYGFGLIHLVGGFAQGATSILRQLVDAGTLSNLPGGFKTRGARIKGDDSPIAPGEWRDMDIPSGVLKDNLLPMPYKEPSQVLSALLDKIVEEGRKFAAVAEMKVSDFDSNSPVGTTMALLERTLKVMSSVQARIYAAMKTEFRLIKDLIKQHGAKEYTYVPQEGVDASIRFADYALVDVLPVADPNSATMSQRIVQWQAVMQLAQMAPQIYDLPELHADMLQILGVKSDRIDKLLPNRKDNMQPTDPMTENMAILMGKPVKAFIGQDHESHIAVHQAAMQDPKTMQMVGQNPMAQQIQAAAMAHLMEHVAYAYRNQMSQMAGTDLPGPDDKLEPEVEVRISGLIAAAAQKLLGKNQNEAAQQEAQQQAQDPVLQLQQAQLELDKEKEANKKLKDDNEFVLKKLALIEKTMKDERDAAIKEKQVDLNAAATGLQIGAQTAQQMHKAAADQHHQGLRLGHDAIKHIDTMELQHKQADHAKEAADKAAQQPDQPTTGEA